MSAKWTVWVALLLVGVSCGTSRSDTGAAGPSPTLAVSTTSAPHPGTSVQATSSSQPANPTTSTLPLATTLASTTTSAVPDVPTGEQPLTWAQIGTLAGGGDELQVTAFSLGFGGEICVGARGRGTALVDSCGVPGAWMVTLAGSSLYVTGTRVHEGDVVVHTTAGDRTVPAFRVDGAYAFVARVPDSADVIGVDDGPRIVACPYRQVISALRVSGAIGPPQFPIRIKVCTGGIAGVFLGGSSASVQGAGAVLKRVGDGFGLLDLGGTVCENPGDTVTSEQAAQLAETMAACATIGWGPVTGWGT